MCLCIYIYRLIQHYPFLFVRVSVASVLREINPFHINHQTEDKELFLEFYCYTFIVHGLSSNVISVISGIVISFPLKKRNIYLA